MNRFMEIVPLALTPLTPIHIGCGEDFEPTNYIIDDGVLYHFEPSRLGLTQADRRRLIECVNKKADEAIREVQRFFDEKRTACRASCLYAIPVAPGVAEWYAGRVGRVAQREARGRTISNQLEIERTAHHPHTGKPYMPGSSLKGSMRTGWLNNLDNRDPVPRDPARAPEERSAEVESDLLGGEFQSDPFRLVRLADAAGGDVRSRIIFAVDRRKGPRPDRHGHSADEKNLFVRRESISGGQIRALQGEISFKSLPARASPQDVPPVDKRIGGFAALARACNCFYLQRLRADLAILRDMHSGSWAGNFEKLIASLEPALSDGRAMLLRVGRHSGAESVTLDPLRWIRIRGGGHRPDYWARDATTIWLAAEREDSASELRPFGWLLVERADDPLAGDLERWCGAETKASLRAPAPGPAVGGPAAPVTIVSNETTWDRARLQYNAQNGTLTAIGPSNARANALAPRGAELFGRLPEAVQGKVRTGQYVWAAARVRGSELIHVEVKP